MPASELYLAAIGQIAAESYLDGLSLTATDLLDVRLANGNNHRLEAVRPSILPPAQSTGGSRLADAQREEFFTTFDIIDHIPNQSSGFSATLLKNKLTGEYTLAFRSTATPNPGLQPWVGTRVVTQGWRSQGQVCHYVASGAAGGVL